MEPEEEYGSQTKKPIFLKFFKRNYGERKKVSHYQQKY